MPERGQKVAARSCTSTAARSPVTSLGLSLLRAQLMPVRGRAATGSDLVGARTT